MIEETKIYNIVKTYKIFNSLAYPTNHCTVISIFLEED